MKNFILLTLMLRVWWGPLEPYMAVENGKRILRYHYSHSGIVVGYILNRVVIRTDWDSLIDQELIEIHKTQWVNIQAEP